MEVLGGISCDNKAFNLPIGLRDHTHGDEARGKRDVRSVELDSVLIALGLVNGL